tara:strand:+ start:61 stop:777 length:717 start_codon:yes stop_codon:yes gene_type:complete
MSFITLIVIIITSIAQSIFGTGVLLFGTPLLLLLGYDFQNALIILLPTSILISLFQVINNINKIDFTFYKKLFIITVPLICLFLFLINVNPININLFVGSLLIVISLKGKLKSIHNFINYLIKYEQLYLIITGVIHGITNLGGALLSAIVFSKNLSKLSKRTTIAVSYLTFAFFQIITIILTFHIDVFNKLNLIYWISGVSIFLFVEKYLYFRIDEKKYIIYSNVFLFSIGTILILNI